MELTIAPALPTREERFAAFVAARRGRAVRLAAALAGPDAAEEVAQEAFARAWASLRGFREDASLDTWFYRILSRQAANHRRWRGVRERFAALFAPPAPAGPPPGDPGLRARITAAMDRLSPAQREVFALVHLEGLTLDEAAALTGRAPGTARAHLHRALASLRADLADLEDAP